MRKEKEYTAFQEPKFCTTGAVSSGVRFAAREMSDHEGCCNFMFFSRTAGSHGRNLSNGMTYQKWTLSGRSNKTRARIN